VNDCIFKFISEIYFIFDLIINLKFNLDYVQIKDITNFVSAQNMQNFILNYYQSIDK
jgi:hypothetical protein